MKIEEEEELENESTTDLNSARSRFPNRDLSLSLSILFLFILSFSFFFCPHWKMFTLQRVAQRRRPMREKATRASPSRHHHRLLLLFNRGESSFSSFHQGVYILLFLFFSYFNFFSELVVNGVSSRRCGSFSPSSPHIRPGFIFFSCFVFFSPWFISVRRPCCILLQNSSVELMKRK